MTARVTQFTTPASPLAPAQPELDGNALRQPAPPASGPFVTVKDAALLEGVSEGAVRKRIERGDLARVPTGEVAPNGRRVYAIPLSELPPIAQEAWLHRERAQKRVAEMGDDDARCPVLDTGDPDINAMVEQGRLSDLDEINRRSLAVAELNQTLEHAAYGQRTALYKLIAEGHGVSAATLRRWAKEEAAAGKAGHAPGWNRRKGLGSRAMSEETRAVVLAAYLDERRLTPTQIRARIVIPYCTAHGLPVPHRATVARFLDEATNHVERTAFRRGRRAFEASCAAKVIRDLDTLGVYELLCGDCRKLDVFCLAPDGRVVRPWIALWMDVRTAGIVGWVLAPKINARMVALAFRRALLDLGVPDRVYVDNGKEFCNRALGQSLRRLRINYDDPGSITDTVERWPAVLPMADHDGWLGLFTVLGIERVTALPFHAWSKPVEALFNAFFKPKEQFLPGWCSADAKDKPEVLARQIERGDLLTAEQLAGIVTQWVEEWNTTHVCGDRGQPPAAFYEHFTPRWVPTPELCDVLLERSEKRKVQPHGIKLLGECYKSPELMPHVGEWCTVRFDPFDRRAITVFISSRNVRLAVPRAAKASWQGWGKPNVDNARCRKAQRSALADTQAALAPYRDPALLDPDRAVAMIAERKAGEAALEAEQRGAINAKAVALAADIIEEKRRAIEQAAQPPEGSEPSGGSPMAAILAKSADAWQKRYSTQEEVDHG